MPQKAFFSFMPSIPYQPGIFATRTRLWGSVGNVRQVMPGKSAVPVKYVTVESERSCWPIAELRGFVILTTRRWRIIVAIPCKLSLGISLMRGPHVLKKRGEFTEKR